VLPTAEHPAQRRDWRIEGVAGWNLRTLWSRLCGSVLDDEVLRDTSAVVVRRSGWADQYRPLDRLSDRCRARRPLVAQAGVGCAGWSCDGGVAGCDDCGESRVRNWAELPGAVTDPGWWLNVVLFAPAAAVWAWLVRRPTVIALVLIGASFAIETMQATVMTGIDDIADFVANSIGVVAGWALGRAALTRLGDGAPACPTAPVAQPSRRSTRRE
jgi:hypothetical protein